MYLVSFFGGVLFVLVVLVDEVGPLGCSSCATFGVLTLSANSFLPPLAALPAFVLNDVAASLGWEDAIPCYLNFPALGHCNLLTPGNLHVNICKFEEN